VNDVLAKTLVKELSRSAYPRGDYHRLYFGEIVNVMAEEGLRRRL